MALLKYVQEYVKGFNAIPRSVLERLMNTTVDDIIEVTKISVGQYVYSEEFDKRCEVIKIDDSLNRLVLKYNDINLETNICDCYLEFDDILPMWGTLWSFGYYCDKYWLEELDGIQKMSSLGFRVFLDNETGEYYFGIDGAGFDFYEAFWIPLYKTRGIQWHKIAQ